VEKDREMKQEIDPCEMLKQIGHHSLNIIETAKDKQGVKNYYWEEAVVINKLTRELYQILKKQN
tara:strand:+ start:85 stop:276 length:192 start_codon:yes stop_codon:yes gene_type:complete